MRISDWSSDVCSSDLTCRFGEDRVAGIVVRERIGRRQCLALVAVLQPAHIAAQLLFDLVRGAIERTISVGAVVGALEHQPLHHMRDDVAGEAIVVRATAESDLGGDRAGEIFTRSEEYTPALQSLMRISYAYFRL